jgi:CO dehydrogenase maturation factor
MMTKTIALAGKGGTGKTTVAALLTRYLIDNKLGSILAIDADPSANLNLALGLPLTETIGDIREDMLAQVTPTGALNGHESMNKFDYLDYQIEYALVESPSVDLLAMGRPEGPGCYCAVNHILRDIIDRLGRSYDFMIIDNEAGLEHLSRRTTRDVDVLLVVTDPTMRGVIAAQRVIEISRELDVNVAQSFLIVNRVMGDLPPKLQSTVDEIGVPLAGMVPYDLEMTELDAEGKALMELGVETPLYQSVEEICRRVLAGVVEEAA